MTWQIKLYDDRRFTHQVGEVISARFAADVEAGDQGRFTLECPTAGVVIVGRNVDQYVRSVLVLDGSTAVFAGIVRSVGKRGDADGERILWAGDDVYSLAMERCMYPPGFDIGGGTWDGRPWRRRGSRADIAAAAVYDQFGDGAEPDRQAQIIAIDESQYGEHVRTAKPTDRLDDLIARAAAGGTFVTSCDIAADGSVAFRFGPPRELPIRFAHNDLEDWEAKIVFPTVTHVVGVVKRDDDTFGTIVRSSGARGANRIERVVDVSGDRDEQVDEVEGLLAEGAEQWYVSGTLTPEAAARHRYPRDYRVGDVVTVEINGFPYSVPIAAVKLLSDENGVAVAPVLGNAPPHILDRLLRRVRGLERYQRRHAV